MSGWDRRSSGVRSACGPSRSAGAHTGENSSRANGYAANTKGTPGLSILSATKAAVRSLARSLAAELAPRGIRVNAISPRPISTPFAGKIGLSEQELKAFAEGVAGQVPLQRFGEAQEVANAALFLASSDSSYVTGTEIVVDGGLTQI